MNGYDEFGRDDHLLGDPSDPGPESEPAMSAEQGDVEAVRAALDLSDLRSRTDPIFYTSALAALDRLAAALERVDREREGYYVDAQHQRIRAEKAELALAENKQAWEDMRAYNVRLEERAREAERALVEMREALEHVALTAHNSGPHATIEALARAALRSEDTSDES